MTDTYVHAIAGSSSGGGSGTVTSVGVADGSTTPIYTVTGSPVTTSGTITETLVTQTANTLFAGPASGSAAQPGFRALVTNDLATVNSNVGSFTLASITVDAKGRVTAAATGTAPGTGTVTSVALADTSTTPIYTVSGSPVTTSGTLNLTLNTQTAHAFLSGPTSGSAAQPAFRAIASADVPTLNQNTTGSAASFTGSLVGDVTGTQGATVLSATTNATITTLSSLSLPGSQVSGNISGNAANVTGIVALANGGSGVSTLTGVTGTGNIVASASPTLTGTALGASMTLSGTMTVPNITATAGAGVQLSITGGTAAGTGAGGAVNISGAAAAGGSANSGGAVSLTSGASILKAGTNTSVIGGVGGSGTSTGFAGGNTIVQAGNGGAGVTTGGTGGNNIYNAGTGGSGSPNGAGGYHSFLVAATTSLSEVVRMTSTAVTFTGVSLTVNSGQIQAATAGFGLTVKSGTNAKAGLATLGAGGTVNVSTTAVTANSIIMFSPQVISAGRIELNNIAAGSGFTILSTNSSDTTIVAWMIVELA